MKKVNSKINKNGRRGFTMVELVVALAIIAIVSIATVFLIITQTNMNAKSIQVVEATNVAENAIECFRFAVNDPDPSTSVEDKFENAFGKTLGQDQCRYPPQHTGEYLFSSSAGTEYGSVSFRKSARFGCFWRASRSGAKNALLPSRLFGRRLADDGGLPRGVSAGHIL